MEQSELTKGINKDQGYHFNFLCSLNTKMQWKGQGIESEQETLYLFGTGSPPLPFSKHGDRKEGNS